MSEPRLEGHWLLWPVGYSAFRLDLDEPIPALHCGHRPATQPAEFLQALGALPKSEELLFPWAMVGGRVPAARVYRGLLTLFDQCGRHYPAEKLRAICGPFMRMRLTAGLAHNTLAREDI